MTEQIVDTTADATLDADGTAQAVPEEDGSKEALAALEAARKRQAGADAARAAAERERDALKAENEAFRAKDLERAQAGMSAEAKLQADLAAANRRADEADERASARVLDKFYPKARAKFPEITDEARLSELETLYAEPATTGDTAPNGDAPRSMRAPKDASTKPRAQTSDEIFASLPTTWPKLS